MKHTQSWLNTVGRLFLSIALLITLGANFSNPNAVQALQNSTTAPQIDAPVDNALPTDPSAYYIPAAQDPYVNVVGTVDGPDVSLPGFVNTPQAEPEVPITPTDFGQIPNAEGIPDMSLPENAGLTITPDMVPSMPEKDVVPIPLDSEQDLTLPDGASFQDANEPQALAELTGNLDDFNRADGPLGPAWTDKFPGITISSSHAGTVLGANVQSLSVHNATGVNEVLARISLSGAGFTQYSGLAFNYADGQDFVFIKIQDNNTDGLFDTAACYKSLTGGGFGLGFFTLTGTFSAATLRVSVSASRSVTIGLTDLTGGSGSQSYVCNGAPAVAGTQFGIASYSGGQIDSVSVKPVDPKPYVTFDEQDGPLGSDWSVRAGEFYNKDNKASAPSSANSLATYNSLGSNAVEADISINPAAGLQYAGLVLHYDEGAYNLFLKVQDNDGNGSFEHGACYTGNNNTGGSFGLGFFTLTTPFASAHMKVTAGDDDVVHITFTNVDGGAGVQTYNCTGAPDAEGYGVGIASWYGARVDNFQITQDFLDDFNRMNGDLGSGWTDRAGNMEIALEKAKGVVDHSLATVNGSGSNTIEADISLTPGGGVQYSALVLDYGAGIKNLFIKVQDNLAAGVFSHAACYTGNNDSAADFGLGFFSLSSSFNTAHMTVSVDLNRVVTITFSSINGGDGVQVYVCSGAPAAEGAMVGIGSYGGGLIDNVRVNRAFGLDHFNRPDGALGPGWKTHAGTIGLVDQSARGIYSSSSMSIFGNITGDQVEGDIAVNPSGAINYSAFILNYAVGVDNLFIKFQNQDADPAFESLGCYKGNNQVLHPLFNLSTPVHSAHVKIWVNNVFHAVTIQLTRIDGGIGTQVYTCNGTPPAEGNLVGIASFNGGRIDNVMASEFVPMLDVFLPMIKR